MGEAWPSSSQVPIMQMGGMGRCLQAFMYLLVACCSPAPTLFIGVGAATVPEGPGAGVELLLGHQISKLSLLKVGGRV